MLNYIKILFFLFFLFGIYTPMNAQKEFSVNKLNCCSGDTLTFKNSSQFKQLYWDFGDNTGSYFEEPKHKYTNAGTYIVRLYAMYNLKFEKRDSATITVNPKPKITLVYDDTKRILTALTGLSGLQYQWYEGKRSVSDIDSVHGVLVSAVFTIVAKNSFGCTDSVSKTIDIGDGGSNNKDSLQIVVKNNILTPDIEDGMNDYLIVEDLTDYTGPCEVKIFNMWGQIVYENANYLNSDGFKGISSEGKILDAGTYYYVIKTPGRKGKTGYIDILR